MAADRTVLEASPGEASRAIPLYDLMTLIAGVALALAFESARDARSINGRPLDEPWFTLFQVGEAADLAGIALVAVVLVRRLRTGGVFRPAEWLLIVNAMRSLQWRLAVADGMYPAIRHFGWSPVDGWLRAWSMVGMVGFLIVVGLLAASRRKVPLGWRLPLLICLPLFAVWGPCILYADELEVLWKAAWASGSHGYLVRAAYLGVIEFPEQILVCLPFAAALGDLARRGRRAWTWAEWSGLGIALVTAVACYLKILIVQGVGSPPHFERLTDAALRAGWWLADLAIAWVAVRHLARPWRWFIAAEASPHK